MNQCTQDNSANETPEHVDAPATEDNPVSQYNHLAEDLRAAVNLPMAERARLIQCDRFIVHDRLQPILDHIDALILSPPRSRARGLCVVGVLGAGKTMLGLAVRKLWKSRLATETSAASHPVLMIGTTNARHGSEMYDRILDALGCPLSAGATFSQRERLVMRLCRAAQVKMLVVDELQDIWGTTLRQMRTTLDSIKYVMNTLGIPVLVLGSKPNPKKEEAELRKPRARTPKAGELNTNRNAADAIAIDEHLSARFKFRELPLWEADAKLGLFLDALEMQIPLKERSCLSSPEIMGALVEHSGGVLDTIVELVEHAALHALAKGQERITPELIETARTEAPPTRLLMMGKKWCMADAATAA